MLTNKNKKQLKAIANTSTHKYQVGKNKIDQTVVDLLKNALKAHELIKIYFNKSVANDIDKLGREIVKKTDAELVTKIGHCLIIYRANPEKKNRIILK